MNKGNRMEHPQNQGWRTEMLEDLRDLADREDGEWEDDWVNEDFIIILICAVLLVLIAGCGISLFLTFNAGA